ncbi:hypothetical protein GCM10010402_08360 [Actinomadura luteofluorescens]|nr:hypothetical protein [Actinomadura glauciflava]
MGRKSGRGSTIRHRREYKKRRRQRLLQEHSEAVTHVRTLADEDLADESLCRDLALWVRAYRQDHDGQGPAWALIAKQARPELPTLNTPAVGHLCFRVYTERLLCGLSNRRWLRHDRRRGSTRQGPRLHDEGTLPGEAGVQQLELAEAL